MSPDEECIMLAELEMYAREFHIVLAELAKTVQGLSAAELDAKLPLESANSPCVIVSHVLGNCRAWTLGLGFDQEVARNRSEEFASRGVTVDELSTRLTGLAEEISTACASAAAGGFDLAAPARWRPDLWGIGTSREISRREALVHALTHANEHLGELHLTADFLRQAR
jgi:hypothetical protein